MKSLQHHQQDVEEVVAGKRFKRLDGQYQGGMDDSVNNQIILVMLEKSPMLH